jgi:SAM-dependent methyltransferase
LCGGSAERLPFQDGVMSAITAQHVIEHFPDAEAAVRECRRVLRPGGTLLLLTPNRLFCDPNVFDDPTHTHVFDGLELGAVLTACGFEVLDLRTLGLPWFRGYGRIPGDWRLRRWTLRLASALSGLPGLRWQGQTLCCAARACGASPPRRPSQGHEAKP